MSKNLVDVALFGVFSSGYYAATIDIKDFSFLLVESVVTDLMHRKVLDEMLNQSCNR